jgi:hypothetical protein
MITPRNWYDIDKMEKTIIPSLANPDKTTEAKVVNLTYESSPFKFRNFLTWSTKESFDNEYFIDNEFYVAKVTMVKITEFTNDSYSTLSSDMKYYYKQSDRYYVYPK